MAVHKGSVIGTVSTILDTGLGLPVDDFCDISKYRKTGRRVFEISGLAIAKDWRSSSSNIFLPLVMMSFKYAFESAGAGYMIITTKSYASYFYEDLFLSKPLMKKAKTYQLASAPKAKTQVLECDDLYDRLKKTYRNASHRKNIYKLVTNPIWNVKFLKSKIKIVGRSILDDSKLEEIFKTHSDLFRKLNEKDKLLLKSLYNKSYKELDLKKIGETKERSEKRLAVDFESFVMINDLPVDTKCLNLSLREVGILFKDSEQFISLAIGQKIIVWVYYDDKAYCEISGEIVSKVNRRIGVKIIGGELEKWESIINNVETEFLSIHTKVQSGN